MRFKNFLSISITMLILVSCGTTYQVKSSLKKTSEEGSYFKGFVLYNPQKNKEIINFHGNDLFTPASNTKLYTFYTAYKTLGDSIKGLEYKKLSDSLIIKGTADPTLLYYGQDSALVVNFLKQQKQDVYLIDAGIDDKAFGNGWSWDDYQDYYMPEKSLLPIYGNILTYKSKGDSVNSRPSFLGRNITLLSEINGTRAINENKFYALSGSKKTYEVPYKTSMELTALLLSLETGKNIELIPEKKYDLEPLYTISLDSVLKRMLVVSDNFIAEQLMLQVGKEVVDKYDVREAIKYSLENYLKELPNKPKWVDGSGLSRYNLFSPNDMVHLLNKMYQEIPTSKLLSYFPVGGKSGTLKNYYKNEVPYIFAKSGTLSNNYCLSGYLRTKKGTLLIFSYMNNHYMQSNTATKREMEKVLKKIYEKY